MEERTVNWLVYTCLIGLIPVIARALVWINSQSGVQPLAVGDLVAFGLVLHSSNIHEVNSSNSGDARWKSVHNGVSAVFLVLYGLILFTTILDIPSINTTSLMRSAILLSVVSFILSFSIYFRVNAELSESENSEAPHG